jgi:hypothetical protein
MTTHIREIHNEKFSDGRYTIGILLNYSSEIEHEGWKETFAFVFEHERNMYTFYETIFDMLNFLLYREDKMKRAFMSDEEFEGYCDAPYIEDTFSSHLSWV